MRGRPGDPHPKINPFFMSSSLSPLRGCITVLAFSKITTVLRPSGVVPASTLRGHRFTRKHTISVSHLCRHCTNITHSVYHILQVCPPVHLPRVEPHFICQVSRQILQHYPEHSVERQWTFITMSDESPRLKPVVTRGTKVQIVDVTVTC